MSEPLKQTEERVTHLLSEGSTEKHTFHNLEHTKFVVAQTRSLSEAEGLVDSDKEIV